MTTHPILNYDLLLEEMMERNVPSKEIFDFPWLLCLNDRNLLVGFACRCGEGIGYRKNPIASMCVKHQSHNVNVLLSQCPRCKLVHYQPSWA